MYLVRTVELLYYFFGALGSRMILFVDANRKIESWGFFFPTSRILYDGITCHCNIATKNVTLTEQVSIRQQTNPDLPGTKGMRTDRTKIGLPKLPGYAHTGIPFSQVPDFFVEYAPRD